jgi:ubiquilin
MPDLGMLGGGGILDPTVMQQMLQNPQIQQMMQGLLSNPQYMNQVMFLWYMVLEGMLFAVWCY